MGCADITRKLELPHAVLQGSSVRHIQNSSLSPVARGFNFLIALSQRWISKSRLTLLNILGNASLIAMSIPGCK
jgi:hypothetical protein